MSGRPITEHAILAALQAMATNQKYSDFMRTMEQHWPGLRTIALPHVTIPRLSPHLLRSLSFMPIHPLINRVILDTMLLSAVVHPHPSPTLTSSQRGGGTPPRIQKTQRAISN